MTYRIDFKQDNLIRLVRAADNFVFVVDVNATGRAVSGTGNRLTRRLNMERIALVKLNKRELADINAFLAQIA